MTFDMRMHIAGRSVILEVRGGGSQPQHSELIDKAFMSLDFITYDLRMLITGSNCNL